MFLCVTCFYVSRVFMTADQVLVFQVQILPFPRLVKSGSEQPGPGATLLGWPKSIYYFKNGTVNFFLIIEFW